MTSGLCFMMAAGEGAKERCFSLVEQKTVCRITFVMPTDMLFSRLRTHSQNMTVAARQIAEKNTVGHLS